jgi:hypothetical protein
MSHSVRYTWPKLFLVLLVFLFQSCGGTDRRHPVSASTANRVPAAIELRSETRAATIHFPPGLYQLESQDNHGYYYRAPGKVHERGFGGALPHDGGIFVSKRDQRKLRGYVVMPGGVTLIGSLSHADYSFR